MLSIPYYSYSNGFMWLFVSVNTGGGSKLAGNKTEALAVLTQT